MSKNTKIDFKNTKIAFASKSDAQLKKAFWMFRMMQSGTLVSIGSRLANFGLSLGLPIKGMIKKTIYEHFVGGESISNCEDAIDNLAKYNIGTILDYSVEGKKEEAAFEAVKKETIKTIQKAKDDDRIPFSVFKITGLARFHLLEKVSAGKALTSSENKEWERVENRVLEICKYANSINQAIFIDAEESWIQNAIDQLAMEMMAKFNKSKPLIFNTIQLYRKDRLEYLKKVHQEAYEQNFILAVKLVRGAYMEKERERAYDKGYESPIQNNKNETDKDFNAALEYCLENIKTIAICAGTHNEESNILLIELMKKLEIPNNHSHVNFSQLYGMSDNLSFNLSHQGYLVSKYVPYGPIKDVMPYLIRRAEENTAMKGQMSRELKLIEQEIKRRKN